MRSGLKPARTSSPASRELPVSGVTPHTLQHTAATWLMQRGVPIWQAAGYLGMSAAMVERIYGYHHPDYMRAAAQAITAKQSQNVFFHWSFHWSNSKRSQVGDKKANDIMVADAVAVEPVSASNFPANREINRESHEFCR